MKQCREAEWEGHRNAAFPYLFPFHQPVLTSWFCSHRTPSLKQAVLHHTLVPWQYSLWLIRWYKRIHQKGLNVWLLPSRSEWFCVWQCSGPSSQQGLKPAGDRSTEMPGLGFPPQHRPWHLEMDTVPGDRAALSCLSFPCRLPGLGGFSVNSPVLLSPIPDLAPCTEPSGVSPSLSETAPSHQLSFCVIVWLWPFLFKYSKGKSCSKALHNHVLFTQSLCAQIILLNNDSSLYLQPQENLPLFASGNFLPKASTGGGVCFHST